jgi:endo-1,4-beta-xylanase
MDHEGYNVAQFLAARGIASFVLKYRLARQADSHYAVENESLADLQRAVQLVRSRAAEWQIDPQRVGIIGFSAGGELAGLGGERDAVAATKTGDPVAKESVRPAFQALIYPGNAKGLKPAAGAPPVFLAAGDNDRPDIALGAAQLYLEFKHAGVSAELHIYAGVGHGFGLRESNHTQSRHWPEQLCEWLENGGFLKKAK